MDFLDKGPCLKRVCRTLASSCHFSLIALLKPHLCLHLPLKSHKAVDASAPAGFIHPATVGLNSAFT